MLGDKQFFFGDEPHTLDLITFVQIATLLAIDPEIACPLRDFINNDCTNLVGVYTRMKVINQMQGISFGLIRLIH